MRPWRGSAALLATAVLSGGCSGGAADGGGAATPGALAQEWATDVLLRSGSGADALQCRSGLQSQLAPIRLAAAALSGVRTTEVVQEAATTWRVTLATQPGDATTFGVTVVRRGGRLMVCDPAPTS